MNTQNVAHIKEGIKDNSAYRLLSLKAVREWLGLSRSTLYRIMDGDDDFPRPLKVCGKLLFVEAEIKSFIDRAKSLRRHFSLALAGGAL